MKTFGSTRWLKNLKLSNPKIRKRKSPPRPQFRPGSGQNSLHFWREVQTRIQPSLLRPQVAAMMFMFCLPIRIPRHKGKVEKILKGSLDSIPSPSPSVKIKMLGGNFCLRCKGKTLLVVVNKLLKTKSQQCFA